jgi:hypothetical protein
LKCHEYQPDHWVVWGGRKSHQVINMECDCDWSFPSGRMCSHVIRILMGQNTDSIPE